MVFLRNKGPECSYCSCLSQVHVMRKLPDEMYPIYTDSLDFWVQTLDFVKKSAFTGLRFVWDESVEL